MAARKTKKADPPPASLPPPVDWGDKPPTIKFSDGLDSVIERPKPEYCPKCGTRWRGGGGPHAPHLVQRNGKQVKVDCAGDEVPHGQ